MNFSLIPVKTKKNQKVFFLVLISFTLKETNFYKEFIAGLRHLEIEGDLDQSLRHFNRLTYSPNFHISLWSKLFEFKIHFISGKILLCKSLIERINVTLRKNLHRPFTYEATKYIFSTFKNGLKSKTGSTEIPNQYSILHQFIEEFGNEDN